MTRADVFKYLLVYLFVLTMGCTRHEPKWFNLVKNNEVSALRDAIADIDVSEEGQGGLTALHVAAYYGSAQCLDVLIDAGTEIDRKDHKGYPPINYAATKGNYLAAYKLLSRGASPQVESGSGVSAVVLAALYGHHDILSLLLRNGFDVSHVDASRRSAISVAVAKRDADAVEILLDYGADPNFICKNGDPILKFAVSSQEGEIVALLLEAGATNNSTSVLHQQYLFTAVRFGNTEIAQKLVESHGFDPELVASNDVGILSYAVGQDNIIISEMLAQAVVNAACDKKVILGNALLAAVTFQKYENIDMLLRYGADINFVTDEGLTPLAAAISLKDAELVEALIGYGADVDQKIRGKTALECAEIVEAGGVVEVLVNARQE